MNAVSARTRGYATSPPRLGVVGLVLVGAAIVMLGVTLSTLDKPALSVIWGSFAVAAYLAGLLCISGAAKHGDLGLARWKLGPWTILWYSIVFGIATVTWSRPQLNGIANEIAITSVLRALWLVTVGITAWALGYRIGPGQPIRSLANQAMERLHRRFAFDVRSQSAPWILYALGIAARLASTVTTGRLGYIGNASSAVGTPTGYAEILGALSLCAPLAVAAAALQVFRERSVGARVTLTILFSIEVAFGAASGGKESFVIAVLAIVIPFSAARRRLPKRALILIILVFLYIVIPFNQAYRGAVNGGSALTPREALTAAPGILRSAVTPKNLFSVLPGSVDYLAQRIREIDNPAIVVQRAPGQVAFLSPMQLVTVPLASIVPRLVWPGKPIRMTGLVFSKEFYDLPTTTSSADTLIGGLYWYGGWVPVIAGMALIGCGVRLLDDALDVNVNAHAIFLVLLLFPILVGGEEDWISILAALPSTAIVWLLAVRLTFRDRRSA